jgi:uncharacterized protein (TIGR03089 family)
VTVTERLLGPILADDPARPLITYYDDSDGTRVELSGATLANWAAKTANWLRDDCDVQPGDRVSVRLPAHWQTAGVLLGAWWCGAHVVGDPMGAAVGLVSLDGTAARPLTDTAAVVALDPLGRGLPPPPPDGYLDFISEIRTHGDHFRPVPPVAGSSPALLDLSVDDLAAAATTRAGQLRIRAGDRVLSTVDWSWPGGLLDGLLAVLAARASLVHCANPDSSKLADRQTAERVTVVLPAKRDDATSSRP